MNSNDLVKVLEMVKQSIDWRQNILNLMNADMEYEIDDITSRFKEQQKAHGIVLQLINMGKIKLTDKRLLKKVEI